MSGAAVSQRLPVLALLGASLIWGLTWLPLKLFEASGLGGAALLLVAHGTVALVALPLLARQHRVLLPEWRTLAGVFCLGGFATIAFSTSLMYGDVVRAMSLFYTMPLWAILGGLLFLGERLTRRRALAALCAIAGAWLILGGTRILEHPPGWIDLLAAASGFAYAMNNVVFRATPALAVTPKILMMYLGVAVFCALLLLAGVQHWPAEPPPASLLALACVFGACWLLAGNIGTQWGVTHMEAGRAAMIVVLELLIAVVSALWLEGGSLSVGECCGAALLISAALLEARG